MTSEHNCEICDSPVDVDDVATIKYQSKYQDLLTKHKRVLEMLKVCEDAINTIIDQGHLNRWEIHLLCLEVKDKIEELKK